MEVRVQADGRFDGEAGLRCLTDIRLTSLCICNSNAWSNLSFSSWVQAAVCSEDGEYNLV